MLVAGKRPQHPLPAVQAYLDNKRFGCLPAAGGGFDQPAGLMAEMHDVASIVEQKLEQKRNKGQGNAAAQRARARRKGKR